MSQESVTTPESTTLDWSKAVKTDRGYKRLENFCNIGPKGCGHYYTTGMLLADEELMAIELGDRVANEFISIAVEYWSALDDAILMEWEENRRKTASLERNQ